MPSKSTIYRKAGKPVKARKDSSGKVVELWIERSRWARSKVVERQAVFLGRTHGHKTTEGINGGSALLNKNGGMCCLGFYARACGVSPLKVYGKGTPSELDSKKYPEQMNWLLNENRYGDESEVANELIGTNDNADMDYPCAREQEKRIRQLFAEQGIKIRFVS